MVAVVDEDGGGCHDPTPSGASLLIALLMLMGGVIIGVVVCAPLLV